MESSQSPADGSWFRDGLARYRRSEGTPLRLVYIPTHRDCPEVLEAVLEELRTADERSDDQFQLLLIDDRPINRTEDNRRTARRHAEAAGQVVNWLGVTEWTTFVDALLANSDQSGTAAASARTALCKPTGSYAGGMNKAAVFAALLGAETLHRRDSDEFPALDAESGTTTLEAEIAALGTPLATGAGDHLAPYVVGSNVEGEPTKDHRDLESAGEQFGAELEAVSRRRRKPGEQRPEPVSDTVPVAHGATLTVHRDFTGRTQVGVSASRDVHHWVPEMPAVAVLGTDHFQKGLLYQLDFPVYWHPLGAYHKYEPWREQQIDHAQLGRYVVCELRYAVLRHYWNLANDSVATLGRAGLFTSDGEFRADVFADAFTDVLIEDLAPAQAVADAFTGVYTRAANAASGDIADRLATRVEALRAENPHVVVYVRDAIAEYAELARMWPRLISAAREMTAVGQSRM